MSYRGDFAEDSTIYLQFPSRGANGAAAFDSAPTTNDIVIYKNNGTTQKTTTNGLTLASPFDSTDGANHLTIDTSNDTGDAGFWTTGSEYHVWISGTIDGLDVFELIGAFSIENRTGSTAAVEALIGTPTDTDLATDIANLQAGVTTLLSRITATLFSGITSMAAWIGCALGKTADSGTLAEINATTAGAGYDNATDSQEAERDWIGDGSNLTEAGGDGDHLTEAGGNGDHLTEAGGTGDQLSDVPWNASWDTEVQSECADALNAYDPPTRTEATSDKDEVLGILGTPVGADLSEDIANVQAAASAASAHILQSTTIATLASQTSFTLTAGSADDDVYNGRLAVITDQSTATQKAVVQIADYTGSTKTVTLAQGADFTVATGDTIAILATPGEEADFIPWCEVHLSDSIGTNAYMRLWLFSETFGQVDVDGVDASASGTISVRAYGAGAGVALFTDTFANTDIVNGCFEKTKASPSFSANTLYVATIAITANGVTYTNRVPIQVGP